MTQVKYGGMSQSIKKTYIMNPTTIHTGKVWGMSQSIKKTC